MTSKDRVLCTVEHKEPDRVPLWYDAAAVLSEKLCGATGMPDQEALMKRLHIDFRRVYERYTGSELPADEDGQYFNVWGIKRRGVEWGQPLSHLLAGAETVNQVMNYDRWPDPAWFSSTHCRKECEGWMDYAIIGGPWLVVWSAATELMGMEEYLVKMVTHPEVIHALNRKVEDFFRACCIRFFGDCGDLLDIFYFGDDFGTQKALFISPDMWREFFKPMLKRFSDLGHEYNIKTMFHSCGAIREIIPDLIDIGIDIVNPLQAQAQGMDFTGLKKDFGDYICFQGAIDHQYILPFGSVDEVRREVRRVIDILAPGGGYNLGPSHDTMLSEFPTENVIAMYDEAHNYGVYH